MAKLYDSEGAEVTAFSQEELDAKVTEATTAKEAEFTPKIKGLEDELGVAKKNLGERANQFAEFRKLNDETVAKLSDAERTIYENGLRLKEESDKRAADEKTARELQVETAIRAKAGTDEKLFTKMKGMWDVIGIEASTPEQIEQKTKMILGAISTTEPDLLASVAGFSNGSFAPPEPAGGKKEEKGFGDTERGKDIAKDLGLILEPPAKK